LGPIPDNLILFDGVCHFCQFWVRLILRNEKKSHFYFVSLQSEFAREILNQKGIHIGKLETVVYLQQGKFAIKSRAALMIASQLAFPFFLFGLFRFLPTSFLDLLYDFVARNRYRWFGRSSECMLPEPKWKSRFLD
jgi:predicted DCC family thiol-disulfide oxidoreductase YuxK